MKTHIALLRGINVGGNQLIRMADLRAFIEKIGYKDARTLLQSGNLVFRSDGKRADTALEAFLEAEAAKHLGLTTRFLVRTASEWAEVIARNPFTEEAQTMPGRLVVMFFRDAPAAEAIRKLEATMTASERIHPDGRQLYASFPDGSGNSKMAAVLMGPRFSQAATGRNWNTVLKLSALAAGQVGGALPP